jgi:hypothetical protein
MEAAAATARKERRKGGEWKGVRGCVCACGNEAVECIMIEKMCLRKKGVAIQARKPRRATFNIVYCSLFFLNYFHFSFENKSSLF